ncbi:hypothetical protein HSBAA_08880 [Vreelandella sulfidaeris]|uniref:Uncharacterized protein n=1 Tax=Vreelandella sulfidaeris TaxID=115553 RepID=A0A455U0W7_9GAMM|nr:hypothetical protein HSBAA_08880 [Halomonas sulfidaeris]
MKITVGGGVDHIHAATQYGNSASTGIQGGALGNTVNPQCHTADDTPAAAGQVARKRLRVMCAFPLSGGGCLP